MTISNYFSYFSYFMVVVIIATILFLTDEIKGAKTTKESFFYSLFLILYVFVIFPLYIYMQKYYPTSLSFLLLFSALPSIIYLIYINFK